MSFPAYPDYKESGVAWLGDMPSHWSTSHLRWLSRRYSGGTPDKRNLHFWENGTIPWLGSGEVNQRTIVQPTTYITEDALAQSSAKWVPHGALVMALAGQGKTKGMVAQMAIEATCNQSMAAIVPNDEKYARFLFWWLEANYQNIRNMAGGDLRDGLNLELLGDIACPLPPSSDQTAIATFLDRETAKIDTLVAEQERLIALLREKRQAVISHAITKGLNPDAPMKDSGIEWLGEIPAHWEVRRLRFVADIETGDADTANAIEDGEYPFFVRSPNVERINGYTHDCEAVMTAGDGAGVGKVFHHFIGKFRAHQRVYIFRNFRDVTGIWFYEYLKALFYRIVLEGTAKSTVDSLRRPMIANFPMTVPFPEEVPVIEAHIRQMSAQFDALISEAQSAIALLHERRAALISAAVTGKIDVRGQTPQSNVVSIDSARGASNLPPLRAVVGAYAIRELGPMGRMAVMKAGYLAEGHVGFSDLCGRYERYAAGPYDQSLIAAMERGAGEICAIVTNDPQDGGKPVTYNFSKGYQPPSDALSALVGEDRAKNFLALLSLLKGIGRDGVEAVATLYAVWNDLLAASKAANDDAICNGVLNDWHPEKAKKFKRADLDNWLDWMRRNGLVPDGSAPRTDSQGSLFA